MGKCKQHDAVAIAEQRRGQEIADTADRARGATRIRKTTCKHTQIDWGPLYFEYSNDGTASFVEQTGACRDCKSNMRIKYHAGDATPEEE